MVRADTFIFTNNIKEPGRCSHQRHPRLDSFGEEPLDLFFQRRFRRRADGEIVRRLFDRRFISTHFLTMTLERLALLHKFIRRAPQIAGIPQLGDDPQRDFGAHTADQDGRVRLLQGLGLQDRLFDVEVFSVECKTRLAPQAEDELQSLFHLREADGRLLDEIKPVRAIF